MVLPRQAHQQLTNVVIERRSTRRATPVAPLLPHKLTVPAKQRLRRNQEHRPALPRQQRAGGGEHQPIPPTQPWPLHRPAQHGQLMPKQRVLHLQRGNGRASAAHSKDSPHSHVHQEEQHRRIVRTPRRVREPEFLRPTRSDSERDSRLVLRLRVSVRSRGRTRRSERLAAAGGPGSFPYLYGARCRAATRAE
jgi:hypothetical protein